MNPSPEPARFADIRAAISEAERFIRAAKKCLNALDDNYLSPNREANAAMKRASMDLTKSLVKLR